jgi:hypothetical protein
MPAKPRKPGKRPVKPVPGQLCPFRLSSVSNSSTSSNGTPVSAPKPAHFSLTPAPWSSPTPAPDNTIETEVSLTPALVDGTPFSGWTPTPAPDNTIESIEISQPSAEPRGPGTHRGKSLTEKEKIELSTPVCR